MKIYDTHSDIFSNLYTRQSEGDVFKKYHLNDLHAGTPEQENYLHSIGITNFGNNYKKCCEELKKVNLYECEWKGKKSYFGGSWFHWDIPAEDMEKIYKILKNCE